MSRKPRRPADTGIAHFTAEDWTQVCRAMATPSDAQAQLANLERWGVSVAEADGAIEVSEQEWRRRAAVIRAVVSQGLPATKLQARLKKLPPLVRWEFPDDCPARARYAVEFVKIIRTVRGLIAARDIPALDGVAEKMIAISERLGALTDDQRLVRTGQTVLRRIDRELRDGPENGAGYALSVKHPSHPADVLEPAGRSEGQSTDTCIVSLGERQYQIGQNLPVMVTPAEDAVLQAFLKQATMDSSKLANRSKLSAEQACAALRRLTDKYDERFAPAIHAPGGKGKGGYHVRICERAHARE
jgi:hypothetical protein